MPKAVLSYNLPEENEEFDLAYRGAKLACAIQDFDNYLRSKLKYEELTEEQYKVYEEVRAKLHELQND